MPIYRIADLNIKIVPQSVYTRRMLQDYLTKARQYDLEVTVTGDDIILEKERSGFSDEICESTALLRKISLELLYHYDGLLLHSAAICYNNRAYLFIAPAGTGKTTHIRLWKKCFGDKVTILNGDKPLLRVLAGKIIVYGTPWQGKEHYGSNSNSQLGGIFWLTRGIQNRCRQISPSDILPGLMRATPLPHDMEGRMKVLNLLDAITSNAELFHLTCNQSDDAAYTAFQQIKGD